MLSEPLCSLLWYVKALAMAFAFTWVSACSSDRSTSDDPRASPQRSAKPGPHRIDEDGKTHIALHKYVRYLELDQGRSGAKTGPCSEGEVDLYGAGTSTDPCALGWVSAGEWVEYEVEELPEGRYHIALRIASEDPGLEAVVSVNGRDVGAIQTIGGSWDAWTTEGIKDVQLHSGDVVRVTFPDGNVNMAALALSTDPGDAKVSFRWFEYTGKDPVFDAPLTAGDYQNPILSGMHPDPSITRVGDDYFMVHSSFAWWPGLPIYHSTDLVTWRHLGHALTRKSQINLENRQVSQGIFAPTIRHHEGTFYIISTAASAGGNFILTAEDPAGPWSDPIWLPEIAGVDPELFFDDDGKVYILQSDAPAGEPLYEGHRAIWIWNFSLEARTVIKGSRRMLVDGGVIPKDKPVWIQAPHVIKKDGWYYLTCAEGGNSYQHSQVVFRSKSLVGLFVASQRNPILTQRDLDFYRANPIVNAGHADFVKTQKGEWWAVFLASRAYNQTAVNTGRETFLLPVRWEGGWPLILEPLESIAYRHAKPSGLKATPDARPMTGNFVWRDNFDKPDLDPVWNTLRGPGEEWFEIDVASSNIVLSPSRETLSQRAAPAFIGRRQQHISYEATTELKLGLADNISAGIAAFQNENHHYYMGVKTSAEGYTVFLEKKLSSTTSIVRSHNESMLGEHLVLGIEGNAASISFFYTDEEGKRTYLGKDLDGRILSTQLAGGFVGTYLGIHARQEL